MCFSFLFFPSRRARALHDGSARCCPDAIGACRFLLLVFLWGACTRMPPQPPSPPSVFILQSHLCLYLHPLTARRVCLSVRNKGSQQYKVAIYITTPRCHHTSELSHIETVSVVWCLTQGAHTHTHSCRLILAVSIGLHCGP